MNHLIPRKACASTMESASSRLQKAKSVSGDVSSLQSRELEGGKEELVTGTRFKHLLQRIILGAFGSVGERAKLGQLCSHLSQVLAPFSLRSATDHRRYGHS